ncbi:hypothetical protein [Saccharopolyspora sp. NPDC002686]|uniref:hypothetical protein n=1 Tax=Saccharopolyspora sp. NPDC002686 TaxID=3154541 RepID=UPI00331D1624
MSVEEVANGLDRASQLLPIQALQVAQSLLEEATQSLYSVAAESNDPEFAEVFESWQRSASEIERASQLCTEVKNRIAAYRASIVGSGESPGAAQDQKPTNDKPANRAEIDSNKFKYFFGKVKSNDHNENRSNQNIDELSRIRIYDTPEGHDTLKRHLEDAVSTNDNIKRTFSNEWGTYQVRDSLLAGPGGFLQLETTWHVTDQGLRLTTMIPKRGKK